ncbi:hypothetical protein Trydic_g2664 [Trypoxylus dichotomus]
MSCVKSNNKHLLYKEYEPPPKKIISEGDVFIKKLADKQQRKDINLQEYLDEPNFEKLSEQVSITSCCSGILPLQRFKLALEQLNQIEDYKAFNLTNEDVNLILDYKNSGTLDKYRNIEPGVLQTRIEEIESLIEKYNQKAKDDGAEEPQIITHKQNEALAMKPNSVETKLLKFALENKNIPSVKLPHPMDDIKLLETNLFSHLDEEKLKPSRIQKQIRRHVHKIDAISISGDTGLISNQRFEAPNHQFVNESKWDQQTSELTLTSAKYMEKNSTKNIEIETTYRLSIDQIRAIPKFSDYTPGLPSNILYLKNLPKCIKDADLDTLFSRFTSDNTILFKIMGGKMRGQAFVTFPDIDMATEALHAVNGIHINGKPIIIEFGRG